MDILDITEAQLGILYARGCPICSNSISSHDEAYYLSGASTFVCDSCALYYFDITPAEYTDILNFSNEVERET